MEWRYRDKVSVSLGFIPELSRKIYAGADMFLMPSQSEPCGLAQMIAMRYGTVPIVRETGGLRDTVRDCGGEKGTVFHSKPIMPMICLMLVSEQRSFTKIKEAGMPL